MRRALACVIFGHRWWPIAGWDNTTGGRLAECSRCLRWKVRAA